MTLPKTADVVIIGGGIAGVSLAYYLAQRDAGRIVVLERNTLGSGSTGRSLACIDLFSMLPAALALQKHSYEIFANFDECVGDTCGFVKTGFAMLAGPEHVAALQAGLSIARAAGIDVQWVDPADFAALEPAARVADLAAICYVAAAGYGDPILTLNAYGAAARQHGVTILQGQAVTDVLHASGRVTGVTTASETISTATVLCAAGPWSGPLLKTIGVDDLGVHTVRHPVIVMKGDGAHGVPRLSVLDQCNKIYTRPERGGQLLAGSITPEVGHAIVAPEEGERRVSAEYQYWCAERVVARYPALETAQLLPGWTGLLSVSPDWQPVLGAHPELAGLYCATGFSGQGFKISPAVGDWMAGLLVGEAGAAEKLHPFRPTRFLDNDPLTVGGVLALS